MDLLRKLTGPVALGLVLAATGCGPPEPNRSIRVVSPSAGSLVAVPFEVVLDASVPLGQVTDTPFHAHLWFGDEEAAYIVCESTRVRVNHAPDGDQVMHVSLRHADHRPAGADTSVQLTIGAG